MDSHPEPPNPSSSSRPEDLPGNENTAHPAPASESAHAALSRLLDCLIQDSHIFEETSEGVKRLDAAPQPTVPRGERRIFMLFQPRLSAKKGRAEARVGSNSSPTVQGDRYNYEQKYPEDEEGKRMDPNARVWRVYLDEAAHFDLDMVENIRDTVDVILVFAGLFSAIVATLVASTITALQPDFGQVTAALLVELIAVQRAMVDGTFAGNANQSPLTFDAAGPLSISHADRWINGLWFVSLAISLSTALLAVLVKQWIQAYVSPVFGTPHDQGRMRHFRYMGMKTWHVPLIAGLLPVLLHLSLFLFFIGLITLMVTLDHTIGGVVGTIGLLAYSAYITTNLLPLYDPQCPYKTPLSSYAYIIMRTCKPVLVKAWGRVMPMVQAFCGPVWRPIWNELTQVMTAIYVRSDVTAWEKQGGKQAMERELERILERHRKRAEGYPEWLIEQMAEEARAKEAQPLRAPRDTLARHESSAVQSTGDHLDADMFGWLCNMSANPSVRTVVAYAVNDLRMDFPTDKLYQLRESILPHVCSAFKECQDDKYLLHKGSEKNAYQLVHAHVQLRAYSHHLRIMSRSDSIYQPYPGPICECKLELDHLGCHDPQILDQEPRFPAFLDFQPVGEHRSSLNWHPLFRSSQRTLEAIADGTQSSWPTDSALRIAMLQDILLGLITQQNAEPFNLENLAIVIKLLQLELQSRGKPLVSSRLEAILLSAYLCHLTRLKNVPIQDHHDLAVGLGTDKIKLPGKQITNDVFTHYHSRSIIQLVVHLARASPHDSTKLRDVAQKLLPLRSWFHECPWNWRDSIVVQDTHPVEGHLQQLLPTPDIIQAITAEADCTNPSATVDLLEVIFLLVDRLLESCRQSRITLNTVASNKLLQAVDVACWFMKANAKDINPPIRSLTGIYNSVVKLSSSVQPPLSPPELADYHDYVLGHLPMACSWEVACSDYFPISYYWTVEDALSGRPREVLDQAWENVIEKLDTVRLGLEEDTSHCDQYIASLHYQLAESNARYQAKQQAANALISPNPAAVPASTTPPPSPWSLASARTKLESLFRRNTLRIESVSNPPIPMTTIQDPENPQRAGAVVPAGVGTLNPVRPETVV